MPVTVTITNLPSAKARMMKRSLLTALASVALFFIAHQAPAQTIGYAEAIDRLAVACKADIAKFCKTEPLGGGRVQRCLDQATVSPGCRAASAEVKNLLQRRA